MLIIAIILIVAVFIALMYAHDVEPIQLKLRHFLLDSQTLNVKTAVKTNDTSSPSPSRERLLFFSDLHAGPFYDVKRLDRVAKVISAVKPTLILFGGDLVTEQSDLQDDAYEQSLVVFFEEISKTAPVVAVYGNHDVETLANGDFVDRLYQKTGVTLLNNRLLTTEHSSIPIYGTDEGFWGEPESAPAGFHGIVLCHQPDLVPEMIANSKNVLALSGHTHRGQVTFFGIPIVRVPLGKKYTYGRYDLSLEKTLLVTSGIGMVHLPFRFGAPPELLIFDLI